jgi:DNA-binding LacI/PurR family transcriptional regulator
VENLKALQKNNVDGVIVSLSQETRDVSYYQNLLEDKTPIVQINRVSQKLETPKVVFEDYKWARLATEHLISMGYKKIYHLAGPVNMIVSHNRAKGFTDMMKEHELYLDAKQPVIEAGIFIEDGRKIAEQLIRDKNIPEAFFCFNDPHRYRCHRGLQRAWLPHTAGFGIRRFHGITSGSAFGSAAHERGTAGRRDGLSFGTHPAGHDQWQEIQFRYHRQT